jgi:sugar phosphate isomerase/epimerase
MPGPATDLVRIALRELDDEVFGLCYDSAFRDRVYAVHLSDRIRPLVDHVIPGEGFIEWSSMCAALRMARYSDTVLMEVMMQHSRFREPGLFLREALRTGSETWRMIRGSAGLLPPADPLC